MKEKITSTESASRVCYETMEAQARGRIQNWLQDLLENRGAQCAVRPPSRAPVERVLKRRYCEERCGSAESGSAGGNRWAGSCFAGSRGVPASGHNRAKRVPG